MYKERENKRERDWERKVREGNEVTPKSGKVRRQVSKRSMKVG
jgi:hypothetical protein